MTYCLGVEAVIKINSRVKGGGVLLDRSKLEAALARPMQSAFGTDAYPTVLEKAAVLLQSVASAHAFFDGNKRTAWTCCVSFLATSGTPVQDLDEEESGQLVLDVVNHAIDLNGVISWLLDHLAD